MSIGDKNCVKNISIFKTIAKVSESKNANEKAERLEKIDKTINYDKMSIVDKSGKEVIGFAKYMDLDLFARRIFWQHFTKKGTRNAR